jgi:hypothetical protein
MKQLMLTVAMSVVTLSTAAAQSVAGEWDAAMNTPGGARPFKVLFVQQGETLSGTVKRATGDVPLEGTIKGTAVKFRYMISYNGSAIAMEVTSTLAGDEMKGSVDIAGQMQEAFTAKRAAGAAPTTPPKPAPR